MEEIPQEIIKGDAEIIEGLENLCSKPGHYSTDSFGNAYYWFSLGEPDQILPAAKILHAKGSRLAMICAYNDHKEAGPMHNACYEFVREGVVYNCSIHLDEKHDEAPSITPIFANADWHEREMMELYGIKIKGHPDPRRLFLDEELDKGLLGQVVPLSIVMNGASSTDLWERILSAKGTN